MRKRVVSQHEDAILARTKAAVWEFFSEEYGPGTAVRLMAQRATEIAALPQVEWRGKRGDKPPRTLYSLTCQAEFGKGPHVVNLPESVLWNLVHFSRFRCAYHQ